MLRILFLPGTIFFMCWIVSSVGGINESYQDNQSRNAMVENLGKIAKENDGVISYSDVLNSNMNCNNTSKAANKSLVIVVVIIVAILLAFISAIGKMA